MKKIFSIFIVIVSIFGFCKISVQAEDIKMYDNYGRYTGVMRETPNGYRMYDSSSRHTGRIQETPNGYNTYDSKSRYTGLYRK